MNTSLTIAAFAAKAKKVNELSASRGRMIFALDATGSRQPTWNLAKSMQRDMLAEAAKIGTLDVALSYFRNSRHDHDMRFSDFTSDPNSLIELMNGIDCEFGPTQIIGMISHALFLHSQEPINAMVYIGDNQEEDDFSFYDMCRRVASSGMKLFIFHELNSETARRDAEIFRKGAELAGGAYMEFSEGSAKELRELLLAVAAFATGGLKALGNQNSNAARLLLTQLK